MTERRPKIRNFTENGLRIDMSRVRRLSAETLTYKLPRGTMAGEIEFTPHHYSYAEPGSTSKVALELFHDSQSFFDELDGGIYPEPPTYLYGTTNPKMAAIAKKYFGFEEIKRHKGFFHRKEVYCVLVGKTSSVKNCVENIVTSYDSNGRTLSNRLESRLGHLR